MPMPVKRPVHKMLSLRNSGIAMRRPGARTVARFGAPVDDPAKLSREMQSAVQDWYVLAYEDGMSLEGLVAPDVKLEDLLERVSCTGPEAVKRQAMVMRDRYAACTSPLFQSEVDPEGRTVTARWVCVERGEHGLASAEEEALVYGLTRFAFDEGGRIREVRTQRDPEGHR